MRKGRGSAGSTRAHETQASKQHRSQKVCSGCWGGPAAGLQRVLQGEGAANGPCGPPRAPRGPGCCARRAACWCRTCRGARSLPTAVVPLLASWCQGHISSLAAPQPPCSPPCLLPALSRPRRGVAVPPRAGRQRRQPDVPSEQRVPEPAQRHLVQERAAAPPGPRRIPGAAAGGERGRGALPLHRRHREEQPELCCRPAGCAV